MKKFAAMTGDERRKTGLAGREHVLDFGKYAVVRKTLGAVAHGTTDKNTSGRH